jgi:hypothetical protein
MTNADERSILDHHSLFDYCCLILNCFRWYTCKRHVHHRYLPSLILTLDWTISFLRTINNVANRVRCRWSDWLFKRSTIHAYRFSQYFQMIIFPLNSVHCHIRVCFQARPWSITILNMTSIVLTINRQHKKCSRNETYIES